MVDYYLQCDSCKIEYEYGTPLDRCIKCRKDMEWRIRDGNNKTILKY